MRSTSPDANRDPLWRPDSPPTPHGDALYHHSFAAHGHPPSIYVPTSSPEYVASSLHHPAPPLPRHSAHHPQQHMSPHFHPYHQITPNGRSAPNPPDSPSIPWSHRSTATPHSSGIAHLQAELARMTPFTQSAPPIRSAAFGSPAYYTPAGPSPHPHYHPVELSSQSPTHSSFPPLVDGFPHPFQQNYQGTDRSTERSLKALLRRVSGPPSRHLSQLAPRMGPHCRLPLGFPPWPGWWLWHLCRGRPGLPSSCRGHRRLRPHSWVWPTLFVPPPWYSPCRASPLLFVPIPATSCPISFSAPSCPCAPGP